MLAVYIGGIFFIQARAARRAALGEPAQEPVPEPASGPGPPAGRGGARARARGEGDRSRRQASGARMRPGSGAPRSPTPRCSTAMILVGVGLYYAGVGETICPFGETGPGFPVALLPIFAMIVFLVRGSHSRSRPRRSEQRLARAAGPRDHGDADIGVRPRCGRVGMQTDVQGPTVMAGPRHGRAVRISSTPRASRPASRSVLRASRSGARTNVLLRPATRPRRCGTRWPRSSPQPMAWRQGGGGDDGIVVKRRGSVTASQEWRWMDDLWLAERLAAAARFRRLRRHG